MTDHDRDKCEICQSLAAQAAGNTPETAQGLNMACSSAATHVGHGPTEKARHIANVDVAACSNLGQLEPAEHMLLTDEDREEAKRSSNDLDLDYAIFEVRAVLTRLEKMRERRR